MKNRTKRILAFLSAAAMALSLSACTGNSGNGGAASGEIPEGKIFAPGTEISMTIASHVSWPFNKDWKILEYFQEETGATFNVTAIPSGDLATKLPLIMANEKEMPDMMHIYAKPHVDTYAASGAYVSYTDNMDKMPNLKAFLDGLPEAEKEDLINQHTSGDGEMYFPPAYGTHRISNLRTWLYRKDVFEKNNLKVPTTYEELYQVAKELKKLYPESYPICFRDGILKFIDTLPAWKSDFSYWVYYDYKNEEWKFGAQDPLLKDVIEYYKKLAAEGLLPPNFLTIDTKGWEELMSTDRGFITMDYISRIDNFNNSVRQVDPDYTLALMAPPVPEIATGEAKIAKTNLDMNGWTILNTGKEDKINNALKLVDWMYSQKGIDTLSWGKEGETYTVDANGKKSFILDESEVAKNKYGVGTYGLYQVIDQAAFETIYSQEQIDAAGEVQQYLQERSNPELWLPFNEEEESRRVALYDDLEGYCQEQLSKFLLDMQPMSEWDNFQKGLIEMGVEELVKLYAQAYARIAE